MSKLSNMKVVLSATEAYNAKRRQNRKVVKLLTGARSLLEGNYGKGWIKGAFARTSPRGMPVTAQSPEANCFCSLGALRRAAHDLNFDEQVHQEAHNRLQSVMGGSVMALNDDRRTTFPQVLIAFDLAVIGAVK